MVLNTGADDGPQREWGDDWRSTFSEEIVNESLASDLAPTLHAAPVTVFESVEVVYELGDE